MEAAVIGPLVGAAGVRFEATHPDYRQALDHVKQIVDANMRAQHSAINEQQLGMLRTAPLVEFAKTCQSQNIDPAAHIYQRAQALGYQPANRAPKREYTSLSNVHGSARAPDEKGSVEASQISQMSQGEFDKFWDEMKRGAVVGPAF